MSISDTKSVGVYKATVYDVVVGNRTTLNVLFKIK